ncbi:hypothetical protein AAHA92_27510 [Salvia divinorum]|uniref:Uncharacterized protein n=1 Tax=Salvia divinorum TaxID=28513 RepID=A0ABD1G401_SALDI
MNMRPRLVIQQYKRARSNSILDTLKRVPDRYSSSLAVSHVFDLQWLHTAIHVIHLSSLEHHTSPLHLPSLSIVTPLNHAPVLEKSVIAVLELVMSRRSSDHKKLCFTIPLKLVVM